MALKYYTREEKRLKLKVKKIWGLILMFVEVTGKKLVVGIFAQNGGGWGGGGGSFCSPS